MKHILTAFILLAAPAFAQERTAAARDGSNVTSPSTWKTNLSFLQSADVAGLYAPINNPSFTGTVTVPDGALAIADTNGLQTALDGKMANTTGALQTLAASDPEGLREATGLPLDSDANPEDHPLCLSYFKAADYNATTGTMAASVGGGSFVQATSDNRPAVQADGSLRFDSTNDYLEADSSGIEVAPGQTLTAIACWKRTDTSGFECLWGWGNSANNTDLVYAYQNAVSATSNQNIATLSSTSSANLGASYINAGVGQVFAQAMKITNNGSDYTVTCRMNGVEITATGALTPGQQRFRLGRSPRSAGTPYAGGDFYEMGLYGGALTAAEIDVICQKMEETNRPPQAEIIDLYIVAGQSNADGKGSETTLVDYVDQGTEEDNIMLHFVGPNSGTDLMRTPQALGIQKRSGVDFSHGPEMRLATRLNALGRKVAICKVAVSSTFFGTSVGADYGTWWPFDDANEGADMDRLLNMAPALYQAVANMGYTPRWRGILWVHGESDGNTADRKAAYNANLREFLRRVRAVTSPTLRAHVVIPHSSSTSYTSEIADAMTAAALSDAYTVAWTANTASASLGADSLHYDSLGLQALGLYSANLFGIDP